MKILNKEKRKKESGWELETKVGLFLFICILVSGGIIVNIPSVHGLLGLALVVLGIFGVWASLQEKMAVGETVAFGLPLILVFVLMAFFYSPLSKEVAERAFERGISFYINQRYNDAKFAFSRATELCPTSVESWYFKGISDEKLGKDAEALFATNKALELKPNFGEAWHNKAVILEKTGGKPEEIAECFNRAKELLTAVAKFPLLEHTAKLAWEEERKHTAHIPEKAIPQ